MEEPNSPDHLSSSLTDLMTSLMVIFILLLLVFVSHTASKDAALTDVLLAQLKLDLHPQGFDENLIRLDPRDRRSYNGAQGNDGRLTLCAILLLSALSMCS